MPLRWYQEASVNAVFAYLHRNKKGNPLVVLPTGAGKTHVIAEICRQCVGWGLRVLVITHQKELIEQNHAKLQLAAPDVSIGIHCAGLKSRATREPVIVGSVQSIINRLDRFEDFDLIVVDEAHLIPPADDSMYQKVLGTFCNRNPKLRIVGLTATPYRLDYGPIARPDGTLTDVCYEVNVRELIDHDPPYLSRLVNKSSAHSVDLSGVKITAGDYNEAEMADIFSRQDVVEAACHEIASRTVDRKGVLLFCTNIAHAEYVADTLAFETSLSCGLVHSRMSMPEREKQLGAFARQELKYIANVNVLTTGFDATHIDCIVLLRGTMSPGLYAQMCGRGLRIHPGKKDCLILDYAHNIERHGPIDRVVPPGKKNQTNGKGEAPAKVCPNCHTVVMLGTLICPDCKHVFESNLPDIDPHADTASDADPLSKTAADYSEWREVVGMGCYKHSKKGVSLDSGHPMSMRVTYWLGMTESVSEWICLEHPKGGFARRKAEKWWAKRSNSACPDYVSDAIAFFEAGGLAETTHILVKTSSSSKWPEIIDYRVGKIPESQPIEADDFCQHCHRNVRVKSKLQQDITRGGVYFINSFCCDCGKFVQQRLSKSHNINERQPGEDEPDHYSVHADDAPYTDYRPIDPNEELPF